MNKELLSKENIYFLNQSFEGKKDFFDFLSLLVSDRKIIGNPQEIVDAIWQRENQGTTGFGNGIAIPHARIKNLKKPIVLVFKLQNPIDWNSLDNQKVELIFTILVPEGNENNLHIEILGTIAKMLTNEQTVAKLKQAKTTNDFEQIFDQQENILQETKANFDANNFYVAVVACTHGLAHTYLAEQKLLDYAQKHDISIKIETHGQKGDLNIISDDDLKKAKGVIIAVDKQIDLNHIKHNNILRIKTSDVLKNTGQVFEDLNNQKKQSQVKLFFKIKLFSVLNPFSSTLYNFTIGMGLMVGIVLYILQVQKNPSNNLTYFLDVASFIFKFVPVIALGWVVQKTYKNQVLTGSVVSGFCLSFFWNSNSTFNVSDMQNSGFFGAIIVYLIVYLIFYWPSKLNNKLFKDKNNLYLDNIHSGFKFILKFGIGIVIFIGMYFGNQYFKILDLNFYKYGFYANHYWWSRIIVSLIFILGMIWDLGGPINKWTLLISGFLFYGSAASNVNEIWMLPITSTSIAIVMPVSATWFRGVLVHQKMDEQEKQAWIKSKQAMLKATTEGFIYFKDRYKTKAMIANVLTSILTAGLIGYFNLKFYGGLNNVFGIIFSFSTSEIIKIPNVVFAIVIINTIVVGGIIHTICYWPKIKQGEEENEKVESTLHSSNPLR